MLPVMASVVIVVLARRFLPGLHHGRFGTLTFFVSVLDEGLDRFPG